jgi:cell division protein FtsQ
MLQRKGKKVLIYFFLLFIVGSINNIELNKIKFQGINNIKVLGLGNENNLNLLEDIKNLNLKNIFFIKNKKINEIISSNNLVEKYEVFKKYPSSLIINLEKTKFLAKINNGGKIFILGSNGKLLKNDTSNNQLPFIFGNPKIDEFLEFKKIIDASQLSYKKIKNFYFFNSKRWDLELKNDIVVKLPQKNISNSLKLISKFLNNKNIRDFKILDARIKNQIILDG